MLVHENELSPQNALAAHKRKMNVKNMSTERLKRIQGSLLAGAAGDALGYTVEFMGEDEIDRRFGKSGITEYSLFNGVARISDDTQMTLFTATGLLFGTTRGMTRGVMGDYSDYIRFSYKEWYRTQTARYPLPEGYHFSWLVNIPELFSRRAPGNTCMSALASEKYGTIDDPINHSKGCGGVMRVAPVGLYFSGNQIPIEQSDRIAAEAAAITHGHELGWLPAAALAHIVRVLAEAEKPSVFDAVLDAIATLPKVFPEIKHLQGFQALMQRAVDLSQSSKTDRDAIHDLGEGWVGDEALAIAVYCALKYPTDMEKALIAAVNHNGDSDSTGAITGNILGAALGIDAIPEKFIDHLELKDTILELADDLYNDCQIDGYDRDDPVWAAKYIYNTYPKDVRGRNA